MLDKIKEYINLIPKGIKNADKVVEGIVNNLKLQKGQLPQDQLEQILKRRLICAGCPFMSENAKTSKEYLNLFKDPYKTVRKEEHCSLCGCGIEKKTASLSSNCGAISWNEENPQKQVEVKWLKYE